MKKIIKILLLIINYSIFNAFADFVISDLRVEGLKRISLDTVLFQLPIKIGMIINQDNISNSIKTLFNTGYFEEISISQNYGVVLITVQERPIINTIKVDKNKKIKSEFIQDILYSKKIQSGNLLDEFLIFELKQELEQTFHSFGKFGATVQCSIIALSCNQVDLRIVFSEGISSVVKHISIIGNRSFSEKRILKSFTLYNRFRWMGNLYYKVYQNHKLYNDLETLRKFYLDQGYAKFCINDVQIYSTPDKKNFYISVYINEGKQYFFKSLIIFGNVLDRFPDLAGYLKIIPGELYNNEKIEEIKYTIKNFLGNYGYIQPNIFLECGFDDYKKDVKLYIYIDVGNRSYVREIRFEDNNITRDFVIRREMQQIEQAPLNYANMLQDQEKLQRFSYFKSVNPRIECISDDTLNQVDLIYRIEERNTGSLNVTIGFGAESRLNMQIGLNQENFLGTGNLISMSATKNRYQTFINASVLKKFFGIRKINFSGKIFYNDCIPNKIDLSNYNTKNYGFNTHLEYLFSINKSYNLGVDYISNNLSQIVPQIGIWRYLNSIGFDPLKISDFRNLNNTINFKANDFLFILEWMFNNLNHTYFPECGSRISIKNNITLPGSDNKYYKIMFDGNYYIPLHKNLKWVLMNVLHTGYTGGLYKSKESPFYNNFYIGGIETVRGFRLNSIGPKAAYYCCNDFDQSYSTCSIRNSSDPVGGNAVVLIKNELIFPIFSYIDLVKYFDSVRISLFLDTGSVWDTHWQESSLTREAGIMDYSAFKHIRISSGVTLKWMSPIGPVIFSYSKLIKKYSGDIEEPFQFSIGKFW